MIKERVIGLDVGSKRIGIAISDPFGWTAQPIMTLHRTEISDDLAKINDLIVKENAKSLVLGLPKNMDGSVGFQGEEVRAFSEELKAIIDPEIKIFFWDERLSSVAAERILIEGNVSRKKRKGVIDKMAAVVILQTYLDSVSPR